MTRIGGIHAGLLTWGNLETALGKALRGKRARGDARAFLRAMPGSLAQVGERLRLGSGPEGRFREFLVRDPKERCISAPCFADRVFHHGLMNGCEEPLDRTLIRHTYACRVGKGTHAAVEEARRQSATHAWYLKMDVRHYFETIPRDRLAAALEKRFAEGEVIRLIRGVIWSHRPDEARGLPIGALTSQHFANFYLGILDHWILRKVRPGGYVRYMDDQVVWDDDRERLRRAARDITEFAKEHLGLTMKPPILNRTDGGLDFGLPDPPGLVGLGRRGRRRLRDRFRLLGNTETVPDHEAQERMTAALAFVQPAACGKLLRGLGKDFGRDA